MRKPNCPMLGAPMRESRSGCPFYRRMQQSTSADYGVFDAFISVVAAGIYHEILLDLSRYFTAAYGVDYMTPRFRYSSISTSVD